MEFSLPEEMWELSLPKEMWCRIWSDLDFETLQKTCVLVCQGWFENIRGNGRLSGQLRLKNEEMEEEEAKTILRKWKELRVLRLSKKLDQVDLSKTQEFLKKVIVPYVPEGYSNASLDVLKDYPVLVNKICFNPQDRSNFVGLDNIAELTLHFGEEPEKPYVPMGVMKNLARLEIVIDEGYYLESTIIEPLFQGIGFSSNLEEVRLEYFLSENIQICGDLILRYLSQIKRLEIVDINALTNQADMKDLLWIPNLKNLKTLAFFGFNFDKDSVLSYETPMANVKRLELFGFYFIQGDDSSTFLIFLLSKNFPALHTLEIIDGDEASIFKDGWNWNISVLESVLNALGSINNLIITNSLCVLGIPRGFDKLMFQSAMVEALDIIEEKFPFDSTELKIEAKPTDSYGLTIIKEKGKGPILKRI